MCNVADDSRIAIVGMAGRFPGADSVEELWRNLREGRESVRTLSTEELLERGADPALLKDPQHVPTVAEMRGHDAFDAPFFGFSHREAEILDPQQRVFLECAWAALEDAGYDPRNVPGIVSLYGGATTSTYLLFHLLPHMGAWDPFQLLTANAADTLTTRVAYKLGFKGSCFTVQCACSTSLVAVHLAVESLLNEACDVALAGGVSINVAQRTGYRYQEGSILSSDGHCRAFDARAGGTYFGSGVGIVVLKRWADALEDGDPIRAVILGSAANNDGDVKVGYTAPGVEGQSRVILEALSVARVDAETIGYVEAHGTGTRLGDPIEVQALTRAFGEHTERTGFCALGSLKSNFGHLDVAAGVAGLIKTVLALEREEIPPSLHYEEPNPEIDFASSPVYVARELLPWPRGAAPRRAGVSSFGIGGTNAHVVLEEAPAPQPAAPSRPWQLLVLSAKTRASLEKATAALGATLQGLAGNEEPALANVAYTLALGRKAFEQRRVLVTSDLTDAAHVLAERPAGRLVSQADSVEPWERPVVFMFSGQGAQHVGMGRDLYEQEEVFRRELDRCVEILKPYLGEDLRRTLYPEAGKQEAAAERLAETRRAQPALFAVEYALARQWAAWGVEPEAMIGHSIGEYVAACLAGVFSLEDALAVVEARGRLMQEMPPGDMLSVPMAAAQLEPLLGGEVSLAAVNAPARTTVSGPEAAIEALRTRLADHGVESARLHTSHAFHSEMMAPAAERLAVELAQVELGEPRIPFVSNLTGTWITPAEATDPQYWSRHLLGRVRFADGVEELAREPRRVLLEVGPGRTLSTLARQAEGELTAIESMRHPGQEGSDVAALLQALGRLWLAGRQIDWRLLFAGESRRRVPLPGYAFERRRYWIEPPRDGAGREPKAAAETAAQPPGELYDRPEIETDYVAPRSDLERLVVRVWQEQLGVERVGVDDNFFELGGDSFLAVQAMTRLRETLGREIPVVSLYEGPNIRSLVAILEKEGEEEDAGAERLSELVASRQRRHQHQQARRRRKEELLRSLEEMDEE